MKCAEIQNGKFIIKEEENITLGVNKGAIVKVLGCGLCGSDIVKYRQNLVPNGTVLGHEIVGEIIEINSDTDFQYKDKIVSSHHIPCFNCKYCKAGNYSMCSHFKETNLVPGGFSERVYISEEHLKNVAYKVPENIPNEIISFYEPLGCCIRAIKRTQLEKNSNVLVIGLGSIGLLMGQALVNYGMSVFGCDLIEERIELAESLGIIGFNSSDINKAKEFIFSNTDNFGVDAVFMTSGADKAIDVAFALVRNGGKINVFSSTPQNEGYKNNAIYYRELTVLGSYSPSPEDLKDSFNMITSGKIIVSNLVTDYPLDNIQDAVNDTIANKIMKAYIKISE